MSAGSQGSDVHCSVCAAALRASVLRPVTEAWGKHGRATRCVSLRPSLGALCLEVHVSRWCGCGAVVTVRLESG